MDKISVDIFGLHVSQIDRLVVAQKGVEKLLSGLDVQKQGLMQFPAVYWKLPSHWPKAYITPVFKKGLLDFYWVEGLILNWIAAFLKNRVQSVVVDGARSRPVDVMSGLPKGIIIGPLLFLLHTNDLPSVVTS